MALDINHPVDRVEGITREEFQENYMKPQKPVVIRGLLKDSPCYTKWTTDYFKEVAGDVEVGCFKNLKEDLDKTLKHPNVKMKFGEYLDIIKREPTDMRLHLFNVFKYKPELLEDFKFPDIADNFLKGFPYMFFGGKGSVARMHQDIDLSNVFLNQFEGKRRVVLFHPSYSDLLYRYPFNVHTGVDINEPDYKEFPGLNYVKGYETIISHGDTLFMPGEYWHYIEYVEGGFGMSLRSLNPYISKRLEGLYKIAVLSNIDDLMRKTMGDKWFSTKEKMAGHRAEKAIRKIQKSGKAKRVEQPVG
jgi:ribosomal protein L16 Arg81 hydroxylase